MISKTLLKQTIKENYSLWIMLTGLQALLLALMGGITPVKLTGMTYYNLLPSLFAGLYSIIMANKLLAAQVDKGTMAYILSTPIKRTTVAITQAVFFIGSLIIMYAISAAAHITSNSLGFDGFNSSDAAVIMNLNLGLLVLSLAFSGICFLISSAFNLSKYSISIGGGLIGIFLLFPIVSMFNENFHFLKNLTIASLYDVDLIMDGDLDFIWGFVVLTIIGLISYAIGTTAFKKRDLPL